MAAYLVEWLDRTKELLRGNELAAHWGQMSAAYWVVVTAHLKAGYLDSDSVERKVNRKAGHWVERKAVMTADW